MKIRVESDTVRMKFNSAKVLSVGTCVPDNVVTNDDLARIMQTSDEWIVTRTGIRERRLVGKEGATSAYQLGATASLRALEKARVKPEDVDAIICATFTPDFFFPSTACKIQHELGCVRACAFDVSAACAGFIYGLGIANAMIRSGQAETILLVGSEVISKTLDWSDRSTSILFGDGAGAFVIQGCRDENIGIRSVILSSDGSMGDILYLPAWGENRVMKMRGNEVFKHAVRLMADAAVKACAEAGIALEHIDLLVPHQANIRIIKGLAERLGYPMNKVVTNIECYGNTSSASIPLAIEDAWKDGRIRDGCAVVLTALGGGVALGSAVIRF